MDDKTMTSFLDINQKEERRRMQTDPATTTCSELLALYIDQDCAAWRCSVTCQCLHRGDNLGFSVTCSSCRACDPSGSKCARFAYSFTLDQSGLVQSYHSHLTYDQGQDNQQVLYTQNPLSNNDLQCVATLNGEPCEECSFPTCNNVNSLAGKELLINCRGEIYDSCNESWTESNPHNGIWSAFNDNWTCQGKDDKPTALPTTFPTTAPSTSPVATPTETATNRENNTSSEREFSNSGMNAILGGILGAAVVALIFVAGIIVFCLMKSGRKSESSTQKMHSSVTGDGITPTLPNTATGDNNQAAGVAQPQTTQVPPMYYQRATLPHASPQVVAPVAATVVHHPDLPSHIDYKDQGRDLESVMAQPLPMPRAF